MKSATSLTSTPIRSASSPMDSEVCSAAMSLAAVASLSWTLASEESVWDSVVLAWPSVALSCANVPRAFASVGVIPETIPVRSPETAAKESSALEAFGSAFWPKSVWAWPRLVAPV